MIGETNYLTHFAQDNASQHTLCGRRWTGYLDSDNPKASCRVCQDEHSARTGWSFPLPTVVV